MLQMHAGCQPSPANYTFIQGQDFVGGDLWCAPVGNQTVAQLAANCTNTLGCIGFNIKEDPAVSCQKTAAYPLSPAKSVATYMAQPCQGFYAQGAWV